MLATEALRAHHDEMRSLMRALSSASRNSERGPLLDKLVTELSLHEQIEDELFYPAMRDISALVTISHAEHRELDDQVAAVLRCSDDTARFATEFGVLVAAVEHHAGLEENQMFPEVEAKVDQRLLTDLGAQLVQRLHALRASRLTHTRMRAKIALLRRL